MKASKRLLMSANIALTLFSIQSSIALANPFELYYQTVQNAVIYNQANIPQSYPNTRIPPNRSAPQSYVTPARQKVAMQAKSVLGVPYVYGGTSPQTGLDCSGLILYAFKGLGIDIPRTSVQQSETTRTITRNQLRPGDLIFFNTTGKGVSHVGIYIQDGKFIHAASGGGEVKVDDLRKSYWQQRLVKYGTYLS